MGEASSYLTLASEEQPLETVFKEKGSRFIARAYRVDTKEDCENILDGVKAEFLDATHRCYAYELSNGYKKSSDAGEPSGTAGKPIANVISSENLKNVMIVVIRYFGGTELGMGGLKRAYGKSARLCIEKANIKKVYPSSVLELTFSYDHIKTVETLVEKFRGKIIEKDFGGKVEFKVKMRLGKLEEFKSSINDATSGKVRLAEL